MNMKNERQYDRKIFIIIYVFDEFPSQVNEKKLEELQLTNKKLETTLQNKTNELNQIINNTQQELDNLKQQNEVKSVNIYFESIYFIYFLKNLLAVIEQLKTKSSASDAKVVESSSIITEVQRTNEVFILYIS